MRMDDGEAAAYLEASSRARISTIGRDGWPHVVPVTYVVLDGALTFWADRGSQKVVNLRRDPRIGCLIDDGLTFEELRGLQITGTAELIDDSTVSGRVADLMFGRVPAEHRDAARAQLLALAEERVVVSVKPERTTSWDHRKLTNLRPQDVGR